MVHKNPYGKIMLSAGEVGSYTVCPEAWRLEIIKKVKPIYTENIEQGEELHKEWSADFDEAMYFTTSIKLIIGLIVVSILFFLLRFAISHYA
jgi:hypothetical protein